MADQDVVEQNNNESSGEYISPPNPDQVSGLNEPQPPVEVIQPSAPVESVPVSVPPATPTLTDTPVQNGAFGNTPGTTPASILPPPSKKKWLVPLIAIVAALVLGGSLFAFKQYTSSADYVWNKSFTNTASGYDTLTNKLTAIEPAAYTNTDVNATMSIKSETFTGDGTFKASQGEKSGEGSLDFSAKIDNDGNGINISLGSDFKYVTGDSEYPDIYARVRGLDKLENLATMLGMTPEQIQVLVDQYNEKWFVIRGSYLAAKINESEQMLGAGVTATTTTPKQEDVVKFLKSLSGSTKEYLLSSDKDKAVLTKKEFVGKEQKNDRATYHYKAGVNKANLKAYGKQLEKTFVDSNLGAWAEKQSGQDAAKLFDYDGFVKAVDDIDSNFTLDIWVDSSLKLIQTVRFYDEASKKSYGEISVLYTGGNEIPFQVKIHTDEDMSVDGTLRLSLNTESNVVSFNFDLATDNVKATFKGSIKPRSGEPKVTAPAGAASLEELFNSYTGQSPINPSTDFSDTESLYQDYDFNAFEN